VVGRDFSEKVTFKHRILADHDKVASHMRMVSGEPLKLREKQEGKNLEAKAIIKNTDEAKMEQVRLTFR
jgi:hypothetical protein